ncbi:MAG: PQQ-binding-like beta-propeller repeat protein [Acidobacteria bacterium]|nr:PQQ-binding-like beta-propeller repeat protein [Acidobacteriota bacterium]
MQRVLTAFTAVVIGAALAAPAAAENRWPRFRGPGALGVSGEAGLPETWSDTENVAWVTEIAGLGWSSPIVWDDLVIVTSVSSSGEVEAPQGGLYLGGERGVPTDEHRWLVYGIDAATGAVRWEREVHRGVPAVSRHLKNTYASETPVTDGEHIYAYFGNVGLFCLDMEGRVVWSRPFEPVATRAGWGTASSPVLHGNRVYVVNDNEEQSYLLALSKETGAELWRVDRDEGTNWSTPYVWEHEQGTEIITTGTDRVRSYDLEGGLLWEIGGMSSIVAPTPFSRFGLLYVSSGYIGDQRRPVFAVRPGARGDLSVTDGPIHEALAWHLPQGGSYNTSPLVYGDYYYTLFDRGYFTCHDARTGAEVYGRQRIRVGAAFSASPWAYNGKIFAISEDGDTYVMKAGPQFELLGTNSLNEFTMATPAIAHGSLFIRTASKLYRITEEAGGAQ